MASIKKILSDNANKSEMQPDSLIELSKLITCSGCQEYIKKSGSSSWMAKLPKKHYSNMANVAVFLCSQRRCIQCVSKLLNIGASHEAIPVQSWSAINNLLISRHLCEECRAWAQLPENQKQIGKRYRVFDRISDSPSIVYSIPKADLLIYPTAIASIRECSECILHLADAGLGIRDFGLRKLLWIVSADHCCEECHRNASRTNPGQSGFPSGWGYELMVNHAVKLVGYHIPSIICWFADRHKCAKCVVHLIKDLGANPAALEKGTIKHYEDSLRKLNESPPNEPASLAGPVKVEAKAHADSKQQFVKSPFSPPKRIYYSIVWRKVASGLFAIGTIALLIAFWGAITPTELFVVAGIYLLGCGAYFISSFLNWLLHQRVLQTVNEVVDDFNASKSRER